MSIAAASALLVQDLTGQDPGAITTQADLAAAIEGGGDRLSFRFSTHDDVRHCWWRDGQRRNGSRCWTGPAEVTVDRRDGQISALDVDIVRESDPVPARYPSVGTVSAPAAAGFLVQVARTARPSVAEDAVGGAAMADSVVLWPRLLELARDRSLDSDVRQAATFWVGQSSADAAVGGLRDLVEDDPDREVQTAAVFALSQHEGVETVSVLIEIAEGDVDPEVKRSAFFWLAQHDDPRVLELFERVLRGAS